jgi:anti-sigma regulatory factor (Ser/Thr protein kinase)
MKRTAKPIAQQFNLLLVSTPATAVSQDKQEELKLALIELLNNAACTDNEAQDNGGEDESEINE